MKINNPMKSFIQFYNKMSNFGKILIFICILLAVVIFFKYVDNAVKLRQGFTTIDSSEGKSEKFDYYTNDTLFDKFYSNIYDLLLLNNTKNDYEIKNIIKSTNLDKNSKILDVGSGTGHHVGELTNMGYDIIGVDKSKAMVEKSKENYPNANFQIGDVMQPSTIEPGSVSHIFVLYFTIYYIQDKTQFLKNCMKWLNYGGYLIIHLVDREKFDPILPPGNPLFIVSPQKYAKERITQTKVTFNDFVYTSNFDLDTSKDIATFNEKFKFNDGRVRKHEQILYMEPVDEIVSKAQHAGFFLKSIVNMVSCAYENQFLYIFHKPS